MRAVTCTDAKLETVELPDPRPGAGQVLLKVLRCGICGSDLHARHHCDEMAGAMSAVGYDGFMRSEQSVVFGHELCGEVLEHGPHTRARVPAGTHVVALPALRAGGKVHAMGLSTAAPGAYAEQVLVQEALMFEVPNGLPPDRSVLTEPLAVAWHAVRRGEVKKRDVAIVIGCGPIGLAVICCLKARGVQRIVAADLSPARRALATACGADTVIDPAIDSPYTTDASREAGHLQGVGEAFELALDVSSKIRRLPAWNHVWRAAEAAGLGPRRPVVFECVGVPGIIEGILAGAPLYSRVVVVGVCMGEDRLRPALAINKEIDLRFVVVYTPLEFRDTLHALAEGELDAGPLVTGSVGLDGVENAFGALANPERHAKILIDPASAATAP